MTTAHDTEAPEAPLHDGDDPKVAPVFLMGLVGVILLTILLLLVQALYYGVSTQIQESVTLEQGLQEFKDLKHSQLAGLDEGYRWADQKKTVVILPIEQAMRRIAKEN